MQRQETDNWCWAANTASIANCYAGQNLWTQCSVASRMFNKPCCPGDSHPECDEDSYLDEGLQRTHNLAAPELPRALSSDEIKDQIDQRRLIGVRIRWANGFGHFITIHGYSINAGQFFVYVKDPQRPSSVPSYNELVNSYQHAEGARWSHTYFSRPAAGVSALQFSADHEEVSLKVAKVMDTTKARKMENKAHFKTLPRKAIVPHDIFTIPFRKLVVNANAVPDKTGYRIIDPSNKDRLLIFDFDNEKSNSPLQQVINDGKFVEQYENIIRSNSKKQAFALRLLRVPELSVEALWYHNEKESVDDYIITIKKFGPFATQQRLSFTEFIYALQRAASAKSVNHDKRYE